MLNRCVEYIAIALIPVSWLNNAIKMQIQVTRQYFLCVSAFQNPAYAGDDEAYDSVSSLTTSDVILS